MKIKEFKQSLDYLLKSQITPLAVGHAGVGKSQLFAQFASDGGHMLADFRAGQMADAGDLVGLLDIHSKDDYCKFKMPKRLYDLIEFAKANPDKYAIMFFDEINRGQKDILQAVFEIVLDNGINGVTFPKNMRAVCAINPPTPEYDVIDFDDVAFLDRFCVVKIEPSVDEWLDWGKNEGNVHKDVLEFIAEQRKQLEPELTSFTLHEEGGLKVKPSRRSAVRVSTLQKTFEESGVDVETSGIFTELVQGILGLEGATAYKGFLNNRDKIISVEDILDNFKDVKKHIEKYSSTEHNRIDMIDHLNTKLTEKLEELNTKGKLLKRQEKNLKKYLVTIPKDTARSFISKIVNLEIIGGTDKKKDTLAYDSELIAHFRITDLEDEKKEETKKAETTTDDIPF